MARSKATFVVGGMFLVVLATLMVITFSKNGQAGRTGFTNASVKGKWGGTFEGNIAGQPFAAIGVVRLDGEGKCYVKGFANIGDTGASRSDTNSCSYNVNPNGLGSVTISSSDKRITDMTFKFVLTRGGNAGYFVSSNRGTLVSGEATRQ